MMGVATATPCCDCTVPDDPCPASSGCEASHLGSVVFGPKPANCDWWDQYNPASENIGSDGAFSSSNGTPTHRLNKHFELDPRNRAGIYIETDSTVGTGPDAFSRPVMICYLYGGPGSSNTIRQHLGGFSHVGQKLGQPLDPNNVGFLSMNPFVFAGQYTGGLSHTFRQELEITSYQVDAGCQFKTYFDHRIYLDGVLRYSLTSSPSLWHIRQAVEITVELELWLSQETSQTMEIGYL